MSEAQATEKKVEEEIPRVTLILRGLAKATNDKKKESTYQVWYLLNGESSTWDDQIEAMDKGQLREQVEYWNPKNMPFCRPGAMYTFGRPRPNTLRTATAKYVGTFDDEHRNTRWQIEYDAYRSAENAAKYEKSEVSKNLPWETLKPFREAYNRMAGPQQAALLIQVLDYVRKWR